MKLRNPHILPMIHRLSLLVVNLFFLLAGFWVIDTGTAVSISSVETGEIPREASLPFRQPTQEEKARLFFEDLKIDTSNLCLSDIRSSLEPWEPFITLYSSEYSVDPDLVGAIVYAESKGDPFRISRDGALGLMQIMPSTANFLGFNNILDPEENIRAGAKYIAGLVRQYGEPHALWAWNAGPERVQNKQIPRETRKFIIEVLSVKNFLKNSTRPGGVS